MTNISFLMICLKAEFISKCCMAQGLVNLSENGWLQFQKQVIVSIFHV